MSNSEPKNPHGSGSSAPPGDRDGSAGPAADAEAPQALAPMDFSTFVMSLGSSAMVNLGQLPPPDGVDATIDLAAARQFIDILAILEEKTRGNLDESESKLLAGLIYDLRVHYVDARNRDAKNRK